MQGGVGGWRILNKILLWYHEELRIYVFIHIYLHIHIQELAIYIFKFM